MRGDIEMDEIERVFDLRVDTDDGVSSPVQITIHGDRKVVNDVIDTLCFGVYNLEVDEYPIDEIKKTIDER